MRLQQEVKVITHASSDETDCGVEVLYSPGILQQVKLFYWCDVLYMPNLSLKGIWLFLFNPFTTWVVSHNVWYDGYNLHTKLTAKIKLFLLRFCRNISVSKSVAQSIPVKSNIIYYGFDETFFHQRYSMIREKKKILYVGRLVSDKGIDTLINAFASLYKNDNSLKLTIVGDGEEKNKIELMISEYQLQESVIMAGKKMGSELAEIMNEHEVMVIPSKWAEPFGIVALEGLACGCKIVCSNAGGLPEAAGKFGTLFTNGNGNELVEAITVAVYTKEQDDKEEVQHFLSQFNITRSATAYLEVFKEKKIA